MAAAVVPFSFMPNQTVGCFSEEFLSPKRFTSSTSLSLSMVPSSFSAASNALEFARVAEVSMTPFLSVTATCFSPVATLSIRKGTPAILLPVVSSFF